MTDTSAPKAMEGLAISKTKELKGTEKRDTLIEIEKVGLGLGVLQTREWRTAC
jgi:hypothetical protein